MFAASTPYDGFTVQNNTGFGSITTLLDGNASAQRNVSLSFVAPQPTFPAVSDIVDVQGTNTDPVVIQISYDPIKAIELFGAETALRLAWLNSAAGRWVNATLGNAGGGPQFFSRAYNPATDFQLGNYGLDTETNVVWAVVNHNSEFSVTALPEPVINVTSTVRQPNGNFLIKARGVPLENHRIQATTSLLAGFDPQSSTLATVKAAEDGSLQFEDVHSAEFVARFYRVVSP
jgi:hypothetical protein